ncbi:MAG: galactose oxidase-like domain-containing protein [Gammaproteobacteria bacterium]
MNRGIRNWGAGTVVLALVLVLGTSGLAQAQTQVVGQWETRPELMPINAVHAGLLRTGKVLVIAGSGNDPTETVYRAAVWDPLAGTIAVQELPWDLWCNGMSFLPDGRALITGGSEPYPTNNFKGLRNTTLFDPETSRFQRVEDMADGRWYPTNVPLPDGRTATFSGYGEDGRPNRTFEIYTLGSGWSPERTSGWPATLQNYPRAHLTPQGDLFFSGWQLKSHRLDPATLQWNQNVAQTTFSDTRRYGSSVLLGLRPPAYPARILIAGGGTGFEATLTAEVIDLSESTPQWRQTGFLNHKRVQQNAVLLPNGRVLAVGGSAKNNVAEGSGRISELYDPDAGQGQWTDVAQQTYWRHYHSTALLLPDGRVASLGGNPKQRVYEQHIEIYSPPYLFTGTPRPTVTGVPAQIGYAAAFDVTTAAPAAIQEAVLMRPGATTHAFDMEQRLVELEIQAVLGSGLRLVGPPNANIAPPGYYMLFLIDSEGVPSVASFVRLGSGADSPRVDPPPDGPPPGDPPPDGSPPDGSPPDGAPATPPRCRGRSATIFVASGVIVGGPDDGRPYRGRLRGTDRADVMMGTAANDVLQGFGGNDWICAGPGNDLIEAGTGNDRLFGGRGGDELMGGAGSDRCRGGRGTDTIRSCKPIVTR